MSGNDPPPSILPAPEAPKSPSAAADNNNTNNNAAPAAAALDRDTFAAAVQQEYDSLQNADNLNQHPVAKLPMARGPALTAAAEIAPESPSSTEHASNAFSFPTTAATTTTITSPPVQPGPSVKKPSHRRTVSWGLSSTSPHRTPLPSWEGTSPFPAGTHAHTSSSGSSSSKNKQELDINDIVNAGVHKEMEAETYILQAVEKLTLNRNVSDPETSRLYSTIAEEEITQGWTACRRPRRPCPSPRTVTAIVIARTATATTTTRRASLPLRPALVAKEAVVVHPCPPNNSRRAFTDLSMSKSKWEEDPIPTMLLPWKPRCLA